MRARSERIAIVLTIAFVVSCGGFLAEDGDDSPPSIPGGPDASSDATEDVRNADGATLCGNGAKDVGEVCDDGNNVGGDGCKADCSGLD